MLKSVEQIKRASDLIGSQAELARRLDVSTSMISQWCTGARPLPLDSAIAIERETGGAVTVEELRPDVDWKVIRGKPAVDKAA
jgi:DNA-binding transcriptional regulator YdaS (Cro superfamily)